MKVLIIPGNHDLANMGDNATLIVAVRQLKRYLPALEAHVVTRAPERLRSLLPDAEAVVIGAPSGVPGGLADLLRRFARLRGMVRRRRYRDWSSRIEPVLQQAQAVILSGQGILTDAFAHEAVWRLGLLEHAHRLGKRTALFSQGLGIVKDARLAAAMRRVLPQMDLIVARNPADALRLRAEFGCPDERIGAGGDDGLQFPQRIADPAHSSGLGVSFRLADYAGTQQVSEERWQALGTDLRDAAHALGATLQPVPIEAGDLLAVEQILGLRPEPRRGLELEGLTRQVAQCRVVVAGSYHSAVFALAMGIPAICLVSSDYYAAKFGGLITQFPDGCQILDTRTSPLGAVREVVRTLWERAPSISPAIASASRENVARNLEFYRAFINTLA